MAGCAASLDDMGPEYDEFADDMAARDEHWENLAPYAVVLGLRLRLTVPVVPAVLQEFKHLQYLSLEFPDFTGAMQPMDLAVFLAHSKLPPAGTRKHGRHVWGCRQGGLWQVVPHSRNLGDF